MGNIVKETIISDPLQLATSADLEDMEIVNTTVVKSSELNTTKIKLTCSLPDQISDYCEIKGDIRVHPNSSTIFVSSNQINTYNSTENATNTCVIKPFARKAEEALALVKPWTIKVVQSHENSPACTQNNEIPAILFSLGGFSGNHYHDFADIIVPLFSTSRKYDRQVHLLASDYKSWWIPKFRLIIENLTRDKVIDIDKEEGTTCYKSVNVGLIKSTEELGINIDASKSSHHEFSMKDFIYFLRSTYSLGRKTTIKTNNGTGSDFRKPRLMIISRKYSKCRILLNEDEVIEMARGLGYEIVLADASVSTNLSQFAELVNSCDVLLGVHGAGLTNMVFLPDDAILIQIVPWGLDELATLYYGQPAINMKLRYLEYKINVQESSLLQNYSLDHEVIRDPSSLRRRGWKVFNDVYLEQQNVKLDIDKFRDTLLKALQLLHNS